MNFGAKKIRAAGLDGRAHILPVGPELAQGRFDAGSEGVEQARALQAGRGRLRRQRGSVLIIVLVTLLFATFALTVFIDKASTDLIVETRDADARSLRQEAYSALEVTLSVLSSYSQANNGVLRSPLEGWNDPLTFAEWTPTEGRTVDIAFEDEGGKFSLPNVDAATFLAIFELWGLEVADAQRLTDALMNWMHADYAATGSFQADYDQAAIPYAVPTRSLRSFDELAAIDVVRDLFYDENGRPNELWHKFVDDFSLLNYRKPNLNSARPDVLAVLGGLDESHLDGINQYFSGEGSYQAQGAGFFRSVQDAGAFMNQGNASNLNVQISALRIRVTVHDGRALYQLNAVVAPVQGGAEGVPAAHSPATANPSSTSVTTTTAPRGGGTPTNNANNSSANSTTNLNYPFTVLEIREDNQPGITNAPPPVVE